MSVQNVAVSVATGLDVADHGGIMKAGSSSTLLQSKSCQHYSKQAAAVLQHSSHNATENGAEIYLSIRVVAIALHSAA